MAIGRQQIGETVIEEAKLRGTYEDFIKPAVLQADPQMEVIRADDVAAQGTITTDILTRLMHNDIVVVDISYPNPNVFYELGIRHACRSGTIIIRSKAAEGFAPFDVSHQRHISYEESLGGVKALADQFRERFAWYSANPLAPDNHLLEHAKSSKFNFPQYGKEVVQRREEGIAELIQAIIESEEIMDAMVSAIEAQGNVPPMLLPILSAVRKNPKSAAGIISGLIKMGVLDPAKLLK